MTICNPDDAVLEISHKPGLNHGYHNINCVMTIPFTRATKCINTAIISEHNSICIYGEKGVGKTYLIHQIAKYYHKEIISISVSEQLEVSTLIGGYVCTDIPGDFIWKPGVLLSAVQQGNWILLEDIHLSSPEFMLSIQSILETRKLVISNRNITFDAHQDFMIFATTNNISDRGSNDIRNRWFCVHLDSPSESDLIKILESSFPHITVLITTILRIFYILRSENNDYTLRELFKICSRITILYQKNISSLSFLNNSLDITICQYILQSFLEVVTMNLNKIQDRFKYGKLISEQLSIPATSIINHYLTTYKPTISEYDCNSIQFIKIGDRYSIPKYNQVVKTFTRPYSWTGLSLRLSEAISGCIELCEPVLLLGETGTGKTTLVQQLANLIGIPLHVVNVHVSTELNDLVGGYRPIMSFEFPQDCYEMFTNMFSKTFSIKKNASYLETIQKTASQGDLKTLRKLFDQTYKMAFQKLDSNDPLLSEWNLLNQKLVGDAPMFSFTEGILTESIRQGHWILLDEINLASHEVLECLESILSSPNGSITLYEKGDIVPIPRHPRFRLFACMNPPSTDNLKRDLPPSIKSRFTSLFVDELDIYPDDLYKMIESACIPLEQSILSSCNSYNHHISPNDRCKIIIQFIHSTFYRIKNALLDENVILDRKPLLTLRTITRVLDIASRFYQRQVPLMISCLEGWKSAFLSQLEHNHSYIFDIIIDEMKKYFPDMHDQFYKSLNMNGLPDEIVINGYALPKGALIPEQSNDYILVPTVKNHLISLCRALVTPTIRSFIPYPILVEGPTSCGKTSLIQYLAKQLGHPLYRINNHEHTDAQEYMGSFVYDHNGKIVFRYGILIQALRTGGWLILDELNLAPSDVLESLNRLLDDNQELYIPETNEYIHPHPSFRLFATQNPSEGIHRYAGRKQLSRAFRNRFMECYFTEIPKDELLIIIQQTCPQLASSFCKRIIEVYQKLIEYSKTSATNVFLGSHGFITLRDLFKWIRRTPLQTWQDIAQHGYMLLAERLRNENDKDTVKKILEQTFKVQLDMNSLYSITIPNNDMIWTLSMKRAYYLIKQCLSNNEPILLVGDTGLGKTSLIQYIAKENQVNLQIVNCHMYSEASDFIGMQRPSRSNKRKSVDEHDERSFVWQDGPLIEAMKQGNYFLLDEINLAEDAVLERLNPVLESKSPCISISDYHDSSISHNVIAVKPFSFFATMNPGGDYGKRELSPALRNRFTEIYIPSIPWNDQDSEEVNMILQGLVSIAGLYNNDIKNAMQRFIAWFANSYQFVTITIRDLNIWIQFIKSTIDIISIWEGFVYGAKLAFIDRDAKINKIDCINKLLELSGLSISWWKQFSKKDNFEYKYISDNEDQKLVWGLNPFYISSLNSIDNHMEYIMDAPTIKENAFRILAALKIQDTCTTRSILLEGDPGIGKTSLIQEIGRFLGYKVVRINLSEDTDLTDLFGKDVPYDGNGNQLFKWQDGPFLAAMKRGDWIILDELNLACQSVLEGLNACLDHRGSIFISELGKTFYIKNDNGNISKIFATQNPSGQGGRKGLPKSFLNRFIRVMMDSWTKEDFMVILKNINVESKYIELVVDINQSLSNQFHDMNFNLRDISRCLKIFQKISDNQDISSLLMAIYYAYIIRFPIEKQSIAVDIVKFISSNIANNDILMDFQDYIIYGSHINHNHLKLIDASPLPSQFGTIEALKISVECHFLSILTGTSGCGKSWMIKYLSRLYDQQLHIISCNSMMDPCDFLGSFERDEQCKGGKFVWIPGILIHALLNGHWILLDNAHLCPSAVLDRLASLFETWPGTLHVHESSNNQTYKAHPNFHVFMTVQSDSNNHVSRPMRNRGIEIYHQYSRIWGLDILKLLHPWIEKNEHNIRLIYKIMLGMDGLRSACKSIKCLSVGDEMWKEASIRDNHEDRDNWIYNSKLDFMIHIERDHPSFQSFCKWIEPLIKNKHLYWNDTIYHILECFERNSMFLCLPFTRLVHELLVNALNECTVTDNFTFWIISRLRDTLVYHYSESSTLFILLFWLKSIEYKDIPLFFINDALLSFVEYDPSDIPIQISNSKFLCSYWETRSRSMMTELQIVDSISIERDDEWTSVILYLEIFCLSQIISEIHNPDKSYYLGKAAILLKEAHSSCYNTADIYILNIVLEKMNISINDYSDLILIWTISIFSRMLNNIDHFSHDALANYLHQLATNLYSENIDNIQKISIYYERSKLLVSNLGLDFLTIIPSHLSINNGALHTILEYLNILASDLVQENPLLMKWFSNDRNSMHNTSRVFLACFYPFDCNVDPSTYTPFKQSLAIHSQYYKEQQCNAIDFCRICIHGIDSKSQYGQLSDIFTIQSRTRKESIQNDIRTLNEMINISLNSIDKSIFNILNLFSNDFWSIIDIVYLPLLGIFLNQLSKFSNLNDLHSTPEFFGDNIYDNWKIFFEMKDRNDQIASFLVEKTWKITFSEKLIHYCKWMICKKRLNIISPAIPIRDSCWMLNSSFDESSIEHRMILLMSKLSNELSIIYKCTTALLNEYDPDHALLLEIHKLSNNISFSKDTIMFNIHSLIVKCIEFNTIVSHSIPIDGICRWIYEYQWNDIHHYITYQMPYDLYHSKDDADLSLFINLLELVLFNHTPQNHDEIVQILDKFLLGTSIHEFHIRLNWLQILVEMKRDIIGSYYWIISYYSYYHTSISTFLVQSMTQTRESIQKDILDLYFLGKSTTGVLFLQSFDKMTRQVKKFKNDYIENVINLDTVEWIQKNIKTCHDDWKSLIQSIVFDDIKSFNITNTMKDSLNLIQNDFYHEKVFIWMQNINPVLSRFIDSFKEWQERYLFGIKDIMNLPEHDKFFNQLKSRLIGDYLKDIKRELCIPIQSSTIPSEKETLDSLFQQLGQTKGNNKEIMNDDHIMIPMLHIYRHISHIWLSKECNHTAELSWFFCSILYIMNKIMIPMRIQCDYFISNCDSQSDNDVKSSLIFIQDTKQSQSLFENSALSIPNIKTFYEKILKSYSSAIFPWIYEKILHEYVSLYHVLGRWFQSHMNAFALLCLDIDESNNIDGAQMIPDNNACEDDHNSIQGMGNISNSDDISNAKNVSEEIECQEQIEGLKGDESESRDQKKDEGDAVDMQDDFEGSIHAPSNDMEQESTEGNNDALVHVDEMNDEDDKGVDGPDEDETQVMDDVQMEKSEFLDPEVWKDMDDSAQDNNPKDCQDSKWESASENEDYSSHSDELNENDECIKDIEDDIMDEQEQNCQNEELDQISDHDENIQDENVQDSSELVSENMGDGNGITIGYESEDYMSEDGDGSKSDRDNHDTNAVGDDDQNTLELYEPCDNENSSDITKGAIVNGKQVQKDTENPRMIDKDHIHDERNINQMNHQIQSDNSGQTLLCSGLSLLSDDVDIPLYETRILCKSELHDNENDQFWNQLLSNTKSNAFNLVELLSRILEPTKVGKLQGDYKSGKRLSMKKVIQYIASGYRRDKIWLRRTKLVKSEYNILVHVDTSISMKELQADNLVLETLAMLTQLVKIASHGSSLTGSVKMSINSFGYEPISILNNEQLESFTEMECGRMIMNNLKFSDESSHVAPCLGNAIELFHEMSCVHQKKIHFILTDGVIFKSEIEKKMIRQLVRRNLIDHQIMTVFILLDKSCTLMDMKQVSFDNNGKIIMKHYLDNFPSDYYIVLRDINDLNGVLVTCISKWIEVLSIHGFHV